MTVLTKIKNFVTRIRRNKEVEEALNSLTNQQDYLNDTREDLQQSTLVDEALNSAEEISKKLDDLDSEINPFITSEVVDTEEDSEEIEEASSAETLSFEEAYISDEFPMTEARLMVKARDRKVLADLLYRPETIKKYDANGNRVLFGICAIPTIAYMSFVATSVVTLPPVAMGVIGFGIAGGIVSGINKITGQNSTLGALYRKVKARFGHAKPKVDLNEYRSEFNKEKSARNAKLSKAVNDYSNKKRILKNLNSDLDNHYDALITTGNSNFAFNDDEISQFILNEITELTLKTHNDITEKEAEIAALDNKIQEIEKFIDECKDNQIQNPIREAETNTAMKETIDSILNDFKESLEKKDELAQLVKDQKVRKENIEKERDNAIQEQVQTINKLEGTISTLEDTDVRKTAYIKLLKLEEERLNLLSNKYAVELEENENLEIQEKEDFFANLNENVKFFMDNDDKACADYVEEKLSIAMEQNSLLTKVSHLLKNNEESIDVKNYVFGTPLRTADMLAFIANNPNKEFNENDHYVFYIEEIAKHNAEIIQILNTNLLLNIEDSQKMIFNILDDKTTTRIEKEQIENDFNEKNNDLRNKLGLRREFVMQEAEIEANNLKNVTKESFEEFKKEQIAKLDKELYNNPTL